MKISFEEIGNWAATFACSDVSEGDMVKVSASGTVSACAASDAFCGVAAAVGHGKDACSVILGGLVTAPYTGTAPAVGFSKLSADGNGGVQADTSGSPSLVVAVNTADQTVTFKL